MEKYYWSVRNEEMENQMEERVENGMKDGRLQGYVGFSAWGFLLPVSGQRRLNQKMEMDLWDGKER